jgi:hypothetical protein
MVITVYLAGFFMWENVGKFLFAGVSGVGCYGVG